MQTDRVVPAEAGDCRIRCRMDAEGKEDQRKNLPLLKFQRRKTVERCPDLDRCRAISMRDAQIEELKATGVKKDEFLAMLAHELRNPLGVVSNAIQLLDHTSSDRSGPAHETRQVIARQVHHLSRLVGDLLDVSRLNRGKIILQRTILNLQDVVKQSIEMVRHAVDEKRHTLYQGLTTRPLKVSGDSTRLMQIVSNLLNNAVKYTPDNGEITITTKAEGDYAVIKVKDSGVGVDPSELDSIFGMFYQVDNSLARSQGGLGIGLTLVRSLTLMHNGTVEAHSEGKGKGSEFTVRLPLDEDGIIDTPVVHSASAVRRRLLVVDDNTDAATSLSNLLKLQGHEVYTANTGTAALGFVKNVLPEYILLDIAMPGMDGLELAERIRKVNQKVVIIAITGYGAEDDKRMSADAGINFHLVKPIQQRDLQELIV